MRAVYVDHMGDDLRVVNSARVSFDKESELEFIDVGGFLAPQGDLKEADKRLINYLAKHNHWTPFSHPQITMREEVPIFVARQRFKHMVGFTYNEVSRRYVDDKPEFFEPEVWRSRPDGSVKQGSGDTHQYTEYYSNKLAAHHHDCERLYNEMIKDGVAPEQARMVLPQNMYTSYYVTGSLAAWARAYKQRIDTHAQKEIQDLAKQWGNVIEPLFPTSWKVLTE